VIRVSQLALATREEAGDLAGAAVEIGERGQAAGFGQRDERRSDGGALADDVGQRQDRRAVRMIRPGFALGHGTLQ